MIAPSMMRNNIAQALMAQRGAAPNMARTPAPVMGGYRPMAPRPVGMGGGIVPSALGSGAPPPPNMGMPSPPMTPPAPGMNVPPPAAPVSPGGTPNAPGLTPVGSTLPIAPSGSAAKPNAPGAFDPSILSQMTGVKA